MKKITALLAAAGLCLCFAAYAADDVKPAADAKAAAEAATSAQADLKDLPFPMLSDIRRELSAELGILDKKAGVAQRATFLVDPENVIRFIYVTDLSVGRNPQEVLRVLDALQTDELCPCNWHKGEATL